MTTMTTDESSLALQVWQRYAWTRDNGHLDFCRKFDLCDAFFRGEQWDPQDLATLRMQRRPALTINKIISTVGNIMGEQIYNRSEIAFRPRAEASTETAEIITKLFKQISDAEQLDWKRSDMFADGIIGSRGFLDIRMDFGTNLQGNVKISNINPKNVLIDHDGEEYDPDSWNEVFVSKWMTIDDIEILYGQEKADLLRAKTESSYPYGYDSIDMDRDRFGLPYVTNYGGTYDFSEVNRSLRVIERQYRRLTMAKHLVDPKTGETRLVPDAWTAKHTANVAATYGLKVLKKLVRRIRWTVICDNVVLHDDWSPYKHFTVVPYFPYFRHGRTVGLVENLLGSQELLNKTSSQELHIVNTTANSGWKVKTGSLTNMSLEELEQKGAQTGLVLELDDIASAEKIQPNSTPTGLDRISYKAEEHIKTISGVDDTQLGQDRADVAAKAIQAKQKTGAKNLAKPLDSLVRTDKIIARNILDLIQEYYTEERIVTITSNEHTGETEQMTINQITPEGEVVNDLTLGEYDVVISSVPVRETLEDSQFEQAMAMREKGILIPDSFVIKQSRLLGKADLIKQMESQNDSPEAQQQRQLALAGQQAEVAKTQAEAQAKGADARLKAAKAAKEGVAAQKEAATPPDNGLRQAQIDMTVAEHGMSIKERELQMKEIEGEQKLRQQREEAQQNLALRAQEAADKRINERIKAVAAARAPKQNPNKPQPQGASA